MRIFIKTKEKIEISNNLPSDKIEKIQNFDITNILIAVEINKLINKKIKENIDKIQKKEYEMFQLSKLKNNNMEPYANIFTVEFIDQIMKIFSAETIKYEVGGAYYCNGGGYLKYEANVNFGFVNVGV